MKKITIGLLAAMLVLAGCYGGGGSKSEDSGSSEGGVKQEIAVSTSGELSTLDSAQYTDVNSSDMIGQVTEGLYRVDKDNKPELALAAAEPKVSDDGLTYTFTLKESKWTNGDAVKAEDFVYAWQTVVDPASASSSSNRMDIFKNGRAIREGKAKLADFGVKAVDDTTLELQLENPLPFLPEILTGTPFMPKDKSFAEEKGKQYGLNSDNFVGNGPFVIKGWTGNNDSWTLEKNKEYWDAKNVKLDKVNVQVVKEIATGTNLFNDGQLDYTLLADTYAQQYKDSKQANFKPKALVGYLSANEKRDVTGNVNARQAILQAIDKEAYTNQVLADGSTPLNGFVPKDFAYNPKTDEDFRKENGDLLPFDKAKAQESWAKAKQELGKDEISLEILSADNAIAKKTLEFLQGQLEDNLPGLKITLKSVPLQNRLDLQTQSDFDLVYGTWTPDYADPINFLEFYDSKGGLNTSGYANEEYDSGLEAARTTLANDPEKRWDELLKLEKILIQRDTAVLPLYQGSSAYLKSDRLQDLQILPFGRSVSYRMAYVK